MNSKEFRAELIKIMPGYNWTVHQSRTDWRLEATGSSPAAPIDSPRCPSSGLSVKVRSRSTRPNRRAMGGGQSGFTRTRTARSHALCAVCKTTTAFSGAFLLAAAFTS